MERSVETERDFQRLLDETRPLAAAFHASGYRLYLVGGIVRDVLAGRPRPTLDIDLTTDALPDDIERLVRRAHPRSLWLQGKRFGTIGATFAGRDGTDRAYEITTHRSDEYEPQSRKPAVAFSTSIVADLSRRDFTVNAIALDTVTALDAATALDAGTGTDAPVTLIDPFGGEGDLGAGVLRTPVDPIVSFSDDPLRMLRAARFVAGFGLQPDPALHSAVVDLRQRLAIVSAERIRDEFTKVLLLPEPGPAFDFLVDTQLLHECVPEFDHLRRDRQQRSAVVDALTCCPTELVERLCALFIVGLDPDPDPDPGVGAGAGVGVGVGAGAAERRVTTIRSRLTALKCSTEVVDSVCTLVALHGALTMPPNDRAVREFVRTAGALRHRLMHLVGVLGLAAQRGSDGRPVHHPDPDGARRLHDLVSDLERAEGLQFTPALDGDAVMAHFGVGPGRQVGDALAMLVDLRMERGPVSAAEAREVLDSWWAARPS